MVSCSPCDRPGNSSDWRNRIAVPLFNSLRVREFLSACARRKGAVVFVGLVTTSGIVACSSLGQTSGINVGPNFPSKTLYATNSNQNAISIYSNAKSGGPSYNIGGANTGLNGPQYLAFDRGRNLWVTNYNPSTGQALLIEFEALATGNVVPLTSAAISGRPRGIAFSPKGPSPRPSSSATPVPRFMVVADNIPTEVYPNQILLFSAGATTSFQSIAGPKTLLKVPGGVTVDKQGHIYVANIAGATVEQFVLPTPTPSPKPTKSPKPTPTPTSTPSGSPSPSPTPSPTPTPFNIYPRFAITAKNGVVTPYSVAVDTDGFIYILDQGRPKQKCGSSNGPAILVFPPYNKKIPFTKPVRTIRGCNTKLNAPTDIKVNPDGLIYVADTTTTGAGIIYIFAAGAGSGSQHDIAPQSNYTSPGAVTGIGLVP